MPNEVIAAIVLFVLFLLFLLPNIQIVKTNEAVVVERFCNFLKVVDQPCVFFLFPLVDRVVQKESLLPQNKTLIITKDNVSSIYEYTYSITDIKMFCYAETESLRIMEEKMKHHMINISDSINDLSELVLDYGVKLEEIKKINKNN